MIVRKEGTVLKICEADIGHIRYELQTDENVIEAYACGIQAVKDYLFLRSGYYIIVEGEFDGSCIKIDKSKILLKNCR